MRKFNSKVIITISLILVTIISVYFFTKDSNDDILSINYLSSPADLSNNNEIIIHIDGEVLSPGIVSLPIGSRISDAISAASGLTEFADLTDVNLAYILHDGQKVYIPNINDETRSQTVISNAGDNIITLDSSYSNIININTATQTELETLPGIGSSTALKIIEYRNINGKFNSIDEIMNISGIGESKFNIIKDKICI